MLRTARLVLLSCLIAGPLWAQGLQVIELRNRMAADLLPVLRPLVEPGGSITAMENKLIVRATPAQVQDLRALVEQLDRPQKQLLITVRQAGQRDARSREAGVSGKYSEGGVTMDVPPSTTGPGVAVAGEHGTVEMRGNAQRSSGRDGGDQQVRVLEGSEALIYLGQEVPYTTSSGSTTTTEFRMVSTGFLARPRVNGRTVVLELRPQAESLGTGGTVNVSHMSTTVSGALGEWMEVGGATIQQRSSSGTLTSRSERRSDEGRRVLVRVEEVP